MRRERISCKKADTSINEMANVDLRNIERVPDRCGGQAVVTGTRIRVSIILAFYRRGMTVEEIVEQYPHLRPADVHDALAYAYDHPEEIDADMAADEEAAAQRKWPGGPAAP
jgi:uncharacterized protein (DUF433 family)